MEFKGAVDRLRMCAFELSNRCNYAHLHAKCRAHSITEPQTLLSKIVLSVINQLIENEYNGCFLFNIYNEPLIDPRLFYFINYIKGYNSNIDISLWTNGWYCDEILLDELLSAGVTEIVFSAYMDSEYDRLKQFSDREGVEVRQGFLDDRLKLYEYNDSDINKPCFMPEHYLAINSNGDVVLCCFEAFYKTVFGNLYNDSLENIMLSDIRLNVCSELAQGNRSILESCKKCFLYEMYDINKDGQNA